MRLFVRNSIGSKILVAFLAMGAIAGAIGGYGYWVLSAAGDMVVQTYDGPLMSINFARAASLDFAQMRNYTLERRLAPASQKSGIDKTIEDTTKIFFEDLAVARERSGAADELRVIGEIASQVRRWDALQRHVETGQAPDADLETAGNEIIDTFDGLIELNADHSFIGRRKAVWAIGYYKYASIGVTAAALFLAFAITLVLARKIVRPLSAAAAVADRIAAGQLQTPIPTGTKDETGVLLRSMMVMQDNIREMVERESARAESAEVRLTDALENSGEGVILAGRNGEVITANSQVSRFFPGLTEQLSGLAFDAALRFIDGQLPAQPEYGPALVEALNRDAGAISVERQIADGRWIRFQGNRTSDGGFIVLLSDFTDIKNREENFRLAKQAAEEASAAKSRFLANMSHELRTPLNAVIGFSEIISGEMFGPIENPQYVEYSKDILRSGRHLLDVINSVLELARSEAGKASLRAKPVDLSYVLLDCEKMIRKQCTEAKLTLIMPPFAERVFVMGEKAKLRQIFLNLLSNAVKFTESGGMVSIDVAADDTATWSISVTDTGIGMSADEVKIALTPFGQVDNRLERRYEGTGLGLPLTKALVELHGGVMVIDSEPGKGTCVRVRLPQASSDAAAVRPEEHLRSA